jgi:polyisoprenoid-binding protein YceI
MTGKFFVPLLLASAAQAEQAWVFEPGQSLVSVEVGPAKARVAVTSLGVRGRVRELDGGNVEAEIRLSASSFTTGSAERDRKVDRDGEIVFEGRAAAPGKDGLLRLKGTLTFRGVSRPVEIPVHVVRAGGLTFGHASFALALREFGIPWDDARIDVDAGLRPESTALATHG